MDNEMMPPTAVQPEDEEAPESVAGSYKICLMVLPNDQFSVYRESAAEEGLEPNAPRDTVDGIENALKEVLALYRANPIGGDEESAMQAGYAETSRRMGR